MNMMKELDKAMAQYADVRNRLDEKTCETLLNCLCETYGTEVVAEAYMKWCK